MANRHGVRWQGAREVKFCPVDLQAITLKGQFEGYASVFHRRDLGRDVVLPGAFRDSLRKRGVSGIKMLFQHDPGQPIGVWENIHEDARGLFVKGRLMTELAKAREVLALIRNGAINGLSIGFRTQRSHRDPHSKVRLLQRIDLWEISIVTFPMLPEARVQKIKSAPPVAVGPTKREFERWLTRDAGFTRSEAQALIRDGFKGLVPLRDARRQRSRDGYLAHQMMEAARLLRATQTEKT